MKQDLDASLDLQTIYWKSTFSRSRACQEMGELAMSKLPARFVVAFITCINYDNKATN